METPFDASGIKEDEVSQLDFHFGKGTLRSRLQLLRRSRNETTRNEKLDSLLLPSEDGYTSVRSAVATRGRGEVRLEEEVEV